MPLPLRAPHPIVTLLRLVRVRVVPTLAERVASVALVALRAVIGRPKGIGHVAMRRIDRQAYLSDSGAFITVIDQRATIEA